ncbi:MAG: hypothetical protein ACRDOJ_09400 [Nocardioidaceae bacterium]
MIGQQAGWNAPGVTLGVEPVESRGASVPEARRGYDLQAVAKVMRHYEVERSEAESAMRSAQQRIADLEAEVDRLRAQAGRSGD